MEFAILLIMAGIVNYRIARMIAMEDGLFDVFLKFRKWITHQTTSKMEGEEQHWLDKGFNCPLCVGFWTALGIDFLLFGTFNVWQWLTIAGIQTLLQKMERE